MGPQTSGIGGLLQPFYDGLKLGIKEPILPELALSGALHKKARRCVGECLAPVWVGAGNSRTSEMKADARICTALLGSNKVEFNKGSCPKEWAGKWVMVNTLR